MDKIKIVHTSDWHLGKKLFRNERLAEQKKYLNWLYDYLKSNSIDILLVAGDIFDIPNPPNNAQQLYFDWVYQVSNIEGLNIIIIGGNHDSSSLLNIPKQFFNDKNCFVYTGLPQKEYDNDCILNIRGKKIGVKTLPYFRNFELINQLERSHLETQENDIEDYFQHFFSQWAENVDYKILCSHHSFGSSLGSGSEHNIFLSGVESFPLNWIKDKFDYTALGHIHKKIELSKNPPIIYPGSPIAMRFSETNAKYISLITLENNQLNYEMIPIPIFRPLLSLDTNLNSLEKDLFAIIEKLNPNHLPAFLEVKINLTRPEPGIADKIRNMIKDHNLELISYVPSFNFLDEEKESTNVLETDIYELFKKFYSLKFGEETIAPELVQAFKDLVDEVQHEDS